MSPRRTLELTLERVHLPVTGGPRAPRSARHVLTATLVWPRPGILRRVAVKALRLEDGTADLSDTGWVERILFKETVQGTFGLSVSVSEALSEDQLAKFFKGLGSSILKLAGVELGDLVAESLGAGLVKAPFTSFGTLVGSSDQLLRRTLGSGSLDLSAAQAKARPVGLEVPLTAPDTIYRTVRRRQHGRLQSSRRTLLKAGVQNGAAWLTARITG